MPKQSATDKIMGINKMLLAAFMAGTGVILWISNFIFSPTNQIKTDIALIQKDISIINNNHEVHIQDIITEMKKIKEDEVLLEKNLAITNQVLIDHIK